MHSLSKLISAVAITSVFLGGCQTTSNTTMNSDPKLTHDTLRSYHWELVEAKDANGSPVNDLFTQPNKPLSLNFVHSDGFDVLSLNNTCNRYSADYKLVNNDIKLGQFAGTMMACPTPEANFDRAAAHVVMGKYSLNQTTAGIPVLTVTSDDHIAHFKAVPKS